MVRNNSALKRRQCCIDAIWKVSVRCKPPRCAVAAKWNEIFLINFIIPANLIAMHSIHTVDARTHTHTGLPSRKFDYFSTFVDKLPRPVQWNIENRYINFHIQLNVKEAIRDRRVSKHWSTERTILCILARNILAQLFVVSFDKCGEIVSQRGGSHIDTPSE